MKPEMTYPEKLSRIAQHYYVISSNFLNERLRRRSANPDTKAPDLQEVYDRQDTPTDINDHLAWLFVSALVVRPKLIVELGVREGESTFVLERVARRFDTMLVSVDLENCAQVSSYPHWHFVQSDDISFGQGFRAWCETRHLKPQVDFLYIDTSHLLEHTLQEIETWFPFVPEGGKVAFHDTNQQEVYRRADGSKAIGWGNRGVIAALERYFKCTFQETDDFCDIVDGWLIEHHAVCNGMTILTRVHQTHSGSTPKTQSIASS